LLLYRHIILGSLKVFLRQSKSFGERAGKARVHSRVPIFETS
ncbi:hypothetical protein scyTo_0023382, partial [Scyliorhinus torazame]|nr:hypothetical protein [Scyliorhinus torazame]